MKEIRLVAKLLDGSRFLTLNVEQGKSRYKETQ